MRRSIARRWTQATFGSIFGFKDVVEPATGLMGRVASPDAPSAIGAPIRSFGGWIFDRLGGSMVTRAMLALMVRH